MDQLKTELSKSEWNEMRIVVLGSVQARDKNTVTGFFINYLNIKNPDRGKLLYSDGIFEEIAALKLLGAVLLDQKIGLKFFHAPHSLEKDVLSDQGD